ncbi:MAG: ABC transporter ATP-binding protein [Bacteroidota bacterium]
MTSNTAIKVSSLSKTYKLYGSRRDMLSELVHPMRKKYHKKFEALKNISFEVKRGEVLGIIGRNGSGKSTLLKILASVVTPTSGSYEINGRLTALLEMGGGFNKDLTGVENVYFLGAIQGYSKQEMKKRLPRILEFAEIGEYAYQPVKTYSSGMYVRLAFSVNIHIDPEILVTDEALAVGDLRFQQKCFRKIREFKEAGKTIVICTHSLPAVNQFCTRAIWLHQGEIRLDGDPQKVTDAYAAFMNSKALAYNGIKINAKNKKQQKLLEFLKEECSNANWVTLDGLDSFGNGKAFIRYAALMDVKKDQPAGRLRGGERLKLLFLLETTEKTDRAGFQLLLNDRNGSTVIKINSYAYKQKVNIEENFSIFEVQFNFPQLNNGKYSFSLVAVSREINQLSYLHWVHDAIIVDVLNPEIRYKQGGLVVIDEVEIRKVNVRSNNDLVQMVSPSLKIEK